MRFVDTTRVRTRFDRRIVAADGVELSADVYLPAEQGEYPVLVTRTASDNNRAPRVQGSTTLAAAPADRWKRLAAHGYVVVAVDVRGRGDSDGVFVPFANEVADGAATVAWARTVPESSGQVGLFGSGYSGFCAWAAASGDGAVDAVASVGAFGSVGKGLVHRGGAVRLDWLFWLHLVGGRTLQPAGLPPWPKIHRHLPLATMHGALGRDDVDWPMSTPEPVAPNAPGLHVAGWWDGQLAATLDYFERAQATGAPQELLIGPWDTRGTRHPSPVVGGFDFGPRSVLDLEEEVIAFFDRRLKGLGDPVAPVRVFVTGRNEWQAFDRWPTNHSEATLHASSRGAANTRRGNGMLGSAAPQGPGDVVVHNPAIPIAFQPGAFPGFAAPWSFTLDQAHITSKDEALVYTATPVAETTTLLGRPSVWLTAKVDAPDADLFVLLSDVFPKEERDLHLCHGAVRLGSLEGFEAGRTMNVEVELDDIAHDLLPGHALRLTVTPSLFPLYAVNQQDPDYLGATAGTVASITLLAASATIPTSTPDLLEDP